jgi:hypothetical protein
VGAGLIAVLTLGLAQAQETPVTAEALDDDELTLPPVIRSEPGEARFEAPEPERENALEAVVTSGQTDWRLPDLGTSLRAEEPELAPDQRMHVGVIPLYDPEDEENDPLLDLTENPEVMRGVGFLKLIEVRFGRRSPE